MKSGFIAYFAGNPVAANLLMAFLIVGGLLSARQVAVQIYPEIDLRTVTVKVRSPGSSPQEVSEDINRRIEQSVIGISGAERIVSTASEGLGEVKVELSTFANPAAVLEDVREAVGSIDSFPPGAAEQPEVKLDQTEYEVLTLAVSSAVVGDRELRLAAEALRDDLLELPSVSQVKLLGTRDREISIELNEEDLQRHNLTISDIVTKTRRASVNMTFGELRTDSGGVILHTVSKRQTGDEYKDIPLITRLDGTIVRLGDVAEIRDGFSDEDIVSEIDGTPAVFVRIDSAKQQSIVAMGEEIKSWLADYDAPPSVTVSVWNDRAQPAIDRISEIIGNAALGIVLVFICLVLVFDLRVAVWITVGIPLSMIGALMFFGPADMTLNMATIFGFFLLIGIVVDDAVVVGESIAAERESGKNALDAAIAGAHAVVGPITIGVLTTLFAFFPFLFVTAGFYQVVTVFPYMAAFVLAVSLIEAFFILPAHLSHEGRWSIPPLSVLQGRVSRRLDEFRDKVVVPSVSWSVRNTTVTLVSGILLIIFALALLRTDNVRLLIFDRAANVSDNVQADIHLPPGAPFDVTLATAERFVNAAHAVNEEFGGTPINSVSMMVGNLIWAAALDQDFNASHMASVKLHLNDRPIRTISPQDIERLWRREIGDISYLEQVRFHTTSRFTRPGVAYALKHEDPAVLQQATAELKSAMTAVPGLYEVSDSQSLGKRHFEIEVTPAGTAAGLTPAAIGAQLRASFHGAEIQRIQRGNEEVKVVVRYPQERRESLRELAEEHIQRPGAAGELPLSMVARITEKRELTQVIRIDGKQTALVSARADASVITPRQARRIVRNEMFPELQANYPGLRIEIDQAARDERGLLKTLAILVPIVLVAIYGLIAAFLRSYWKPVIAVAGIPLAFSGAVLSHWLLGWDFTAMSIFGVIGVSGIVVNDALVLLDRYNRIRVENDMFPAIAAASAATRHRFRAVLLTSLTTILGLSPLLYERGDELVFLVPFVVSMLGGLVFATLATLLLLPTLVMIVEGRKE